MTHTDPRKSLDLGFQASEVQNLHIHRATEVLRLPLEAPLVVAAEMGKLDRLELKHTDYGPSTVTKLRVEGFDMKVWMAPDDIT